VKGSLKREDIFGLRDSRRVDEPPGPWRVTWKQPDACFRVWVLSPADRAEASNGPGQQTLNQPGRRVRYLDIIREGEDLDSTFIAIHEPGGSDGPTLINRAERLRVPADAGTDAVALRIDSAWGTYVVFSDFDHAAEVAGIRFAGAFGILNQTPDGPRWMLASEASTFVADDFGFTNATPAWSGNILSQSEAELTTRTPRPADWETLPDNVRSYVLVGTEQESAGLPVSGSNHKSIQVERFPLPAAERFHWPNVRCLRR
jgi:hypothetical protein